MGSFYESDTYGWAIEQAERLRNGEPIDIENVAEELDGLAKTEKSSLVHNLEVLLMQMLNWHYQVDRRSRSWSLSILEHRDRVQNVLHDNPTLKPKLPEILLNAYRRARLKAARETTLELKAFPEECPFSITQILKDEADVD